nr:Chain B, Nonstructural protein 13/14 [Severe acute respiratory syndrome coronavirus 2]
NVATLQAENV